MKIGVIGAGSWGTALAITLSGKKHDVAIWDINKEHLAEIRVNNENVRYLPGIKFNDNLLAKDDLQEVIKGADIVLFSAPAQHFRSALKSALPFLDENQIIVNVAKGIEQKTLLRMSEIADEIAPNLKYVALSGPSHAEEVGKGMPTTVAVASKDFKLARAVQEAFSTNNFRIYTSDDVAGLELGGALKNILALGAGISDGIGYGDNAKAALMTRGIAEIARLGVKLGAKRETFAGLSGIGDLIVTCTSVHSRNRKCGLLMGEGVSPEDALKRVGMVVEGMYTTEAAYQLAVRAGVEMPITEMIYRVINNMIDPRTAVETLMTRDKKNELDQAR